MRLIPQDVLEIYPCALPVSVSVRRRSRTSSRSCGSSSSGPCWRSSIGIRARLHAGTGAPEWQAPCLQPAFGRSPLRTSRFPLLASSRDAGCVLACRDRCCSASLTLVRSVPRPPPDPRPAIAGSKSGRTPDSWPPCRAPIFTPAIRSPPACTDSLSGARGEPMTQRTPAVALRPLDDGQLDQAAPISRDADAPVGRSGGSGAGRALVASPLTNQEGTHDQDVS